MGEDRGDTRNARPVCPLTYRVPFAGIASLQQYHYCITNQIRAQEMCGNLNLSQRGDIPGIYRHNLTTSVTYSHWLCTFSLYHHSKLSSITKPYQGLSDLPSLALVGATNNSSSVLARYSASRPVNVSPDERQTNRCSTTPVEQAPLIRSQTSSRSHCGERSSQSRACGKGMKHSASAQM